MWVLIGCNAQNDSREHNDKSNSQSIVAIKEAAIKGQMKGMEVPLKSTYSKVVEVYGEPKEISNEECWTYSHDHPKTKANFYFNYDSCANGLNVLKPEAIVNKISVPVESLDIQMTAEDVKLALGKPNKEFWDEAYDGYYLIYELDQSQLVFFAKENTDPINISRVQVITS
ncbi:hypothetical protein [Paenibacillus tyrfis]|uniref:hypothetical protein n=1 Tax=Paenibacillus tyrfis TaxID=1501230 RepID=UPI0020A1E089|nr:hypothetical protein [Paenibacillus tyrfis]MCP1306111.1 hypothetical protein [Paenibacillus tyrfis]